MSEIQRAEHWLKTVVGGQPLNRDDLGEEDSSNGTLRGISPTVLKLAPQLQQTMQQELINAPRFDGPQIGVPGMSPGGNSVRSPNLNNRTPKPPTTDKGE
jgi:hypothetical protein